MIEKTYKITYEKLSQIMDLSILKKHFQIGKSFSFLLRCNTYQGEIESMQLCNEEHTPLFITGECDSMVDVYDYKNQLLGEIYLPRLSLIEENGTVTESSIDHAAINGLLKIYIEQNFRKQITLNDMVLDKGQLIDRFQRMICSGHYDETILSITGYNSLQQFFQELTKDIQSYKRTLSDSLSTTIPSHPKPVEDSNKVPLENHAETESKASTEKFSEEVTSKELEEKITNGISQQHQEKVSPHLKKKIKKQVSEEVDPPTPPKKSTLERLNFLNTILSQLNQKQLPEEEEKE